MANASEDKKPSKWINIGNSKSAMKISFPRKPFELSFAVSFKNEAKKGNLRIYSLPIEEKKGLLVLGVLSAPHLEKEVLQEDRFRKYFDSYIVKYLFYFPQIFQKNQTFNSKLSEFQGMPILSFDFTYQDEEKVQMIKGAAILHEQTLYFLFYLAPKKGYDDELLKEFVGTFSI
jgi:hypothetical protein